MRALGPSALAETPAGLEGRIRDLERRWMPGLPRGSRGRGLTLSDDPALGSTRAFHVVNTISAIDLTDADNFDEVTARLRYKGDHTLLYVEMRAEGPDIPDDLIEEIGDRFDDQTYDVDRAAFGEETDIDENGRVIVLMTATVNALNTEQSVEAGGVLSGFFFGIDLLFHPTLNPFSNDAEIFYSLVPDPDKQFGAAPVGGDQVAGFLDGVLAHEFEHMINAGQRLEQGSAFEVVWLDEGLAHYAETLNGVTFDGSTDLQNSLRSALWLQRPFAQSVVSGSDNLEQRGAAWLLVAYLVGHYGEGILRDLVEGPFTGIPNVENAADTSFQFLFYRFTAALLLDGQGIASDPFFDIPNLDVRQRFQSAKQFWAGTSRLPGPYLGVRVSNVPGSLEQHRGHDLGWKPRVLRRRRDRARNPSRGRPGGPSGQSPGNDHPHAMTPLARQGGLAEVARARLAAEGPMRSHVLAREVLGMARVEESVAERLVGTLLGEDRAFERTGDGCWRLTPVSPAGAARSLSEIPFVVVDVETTGGRPPGTG